MSAMIEISEWHAKTVRAWLLALLRFAVTLDDDDKLAALAAAAEIDKLSSQQAGLCGFRFFRRASVEVCGAMAEPRHAGSTAVLRRHMEWVKDDRMKRAFAAVLELEMDTEKPRIRPMKAKARDDLWKGLRC